MSDATQCQRCGLAATGGDGNPDARLMRRVRKGVCVDCAVVIVLQKLDAAHGGHLLPAAPDGHRDWKSALRLTHVRDQFAVVMGAGNADAKPDEIDWDRVIELWDIAPREEGLLF